MGLFGGKKKVAPASSVPGWILKADAAITFAKQTHTLGDAIKFMSGACGSDFADRLLCSDKEPVGLTRYQKISWVKEDDSTWLKCVTYENISLSQRVTVPLGENYKERWFVSVQEQKIERMEFVYE